MAAVHAPVEARVINDLMAKAAQCASEAAFFVIAVIILTLIRVNLAATRDAYRGPLPWEGLRCIYFPHSSCTEGCAAEQSSSPQWAIKSAARRGGGAAAAHVRNSSWIWHRQLAVGQWQWREVAS